MFDFLSNTFSGIFSRLTGQSHVSEKNINETLDKIRDSLIQADVPYGLVDTFLKEITDKVIGKKVLFSLKPGEYLVKIVHDVLVEFLGGQSSVPFAPQLPAIIMVMGLQGSGKTTTLAKLAYFLQEQAKQKGKKRNILLASVDFYRPAALQQLEILSGEIGASFYKSPFNDPLKAAKDIAHWYKTQGFDLLLLDTAGRLHIDTVLLHELSEIDRALEPKYKLLVLDAMTGQESLRIAQAFEQAVGFNGALMTKIDSDTRGGAAFAFRYALKKPLLFFGTGEKYTDLELCRPERMANRILGMGDIHSLLDRVQEKVKQSEQEKLAKSFNQGKLTLQDFAQMIEMMNKLGPMTQVAKYMPGAAGLNLSAANLQQGELEMKRFKAIISSMTLKERLYPKILDSSRKQRIAKGSGSTVVHVNQLLERFEQSQQFAKLFKKLGRVPGF